MAEPINLLIFDKSEDNVVNYLREFRKQGYEPRYEHLNSLESLRTKSLLTRWDAAIIGNDNDPNLEHEAINILIQDCWESPIIIVSQTPADNHPKAMPHPGCVRLENSVMTSLPLLVEREWRKAEGRRERTLAKETLQEKEKALLEEKELLHVTLKAIGDGVIATDINGRVILMNKAAEEIIDCPAADSMGQRLCEVMPGIRMKARETCREILINILGQEVEVASQTMACFENHKVMITPQGEDHIIAITGTPIHDDLDAIIGVVVVLTDITEKRRVEEDRIRLGKLRALGLLAGGIAHNFNNKLAVVLGNINLAKLNTSPAGEIYKHLTIAEQASSEIADLTQQLLTFSPGGQPIKRLVRINELLKRTAGHALRNTSWTCSISVPDDLWPVEGDEGQINHAFAGLISSIALSYPEQGRLELRAENLEQPAAGGAIRRQIQITIDCHGPEISREKIEHLFDPYFFAENWQNGLGLATSHSIIQKHGGHITASGNSGCTSLRIRIPAAVENEHIDAHDEDEIRQGKGHILLMEDEKALLDIFREMLERLGYSVSCANDGQEAVEAWRQALVSNRAFDLAILDMTVPGGMGGVEAMRQLRRLQPDAKAIISSGYTNDPIMANYEKYGFQGVLCKPFKMREVSNLLKKFTN